MLTGDQTVLITGGAGFVGSWLVREVLERTAARVVVLDNLFNGKRRLLPTSDRLEVHQLDLRRAEAVEELVTKMKPAWVFHLAAIHFIPYCNAHPAETLAVNVVGTQNLLEACRRAEPERLVAISSAAVYPISDVAHQEEDTPGPTDIYGLTKWINEQQLAQFAGKVRTRCAAARLFNVYGPHETNPHVIPEILRQMGEGQESIALGNVKPKRDYIYVTDVASGLFAMAERNEHSFRVYNLGTACEYSVEEIIEQLRRLSGQPLRIQTAADRVRPGDRMHLLCDRTRIGKELGWQPRQTLESGMAALWQWEQQQQNRPGLVTAAG
jgi:UDP-glucose 4-epimerase